MNCRDDIYWAPRVNLNKIKTLYLCNAAGIYDEEMIEDTGIALYLRCQGILEYTWAVEGRVRCKRCQKNSAESLIMRKTKEPRELLRCHVCGWQIQWRVYLTQTKKKSSGQLYAGRARPAFEEFYARFPRCKEANEKMLAIDRLIHQFHWTLRRGEKAPVGDRTACVNLLEGTAVQILELLDNLAYGENTDINLLETRRMWKSQGLSVKRKGV